VRAEAPVIFRLEDGDRALLRLLQLDEVRHDCSGAPTPGRTRCSKT
jgi:hypothetical protein